MPRIFEAPPGFVLNPDYLVPELGAQRDALLEALKTVLAAGRGTSGRIILEAADEAAARAAIAAVEEGK